MAVGQNFNNSLALHARSMLLAEELRLEVQKQQTRKRTKEYMADSCFAGCRRLISAYILASLSQEELAERHRRHPPLGGGQIQQQLSAGQSQSDGNHARPGTGRRGSRQPDPSRQPVGGQVAASRQRVRAPEQRENLT